MKTFKKLVLGLILSLLPTFCFAQSICDKMCFANAGPDVNSCCGGVQIGNIGSNCQNNGGDPNCPPGSLSFSWSPTTGLSNSTICNPMANPATTTTYTLTVTFTCGVDAGGASCCCDGCNGTTCTNAGPPNECNGTQQRTDQVVFTRVTPSCCRLIYPELAPEVSDNNIKVYPIPASGNIQIDMLTQEISRTIHVYDVNGKCVFRTTNVSEKSLLVDLTDKPKGVYFVQVKNQDAVICYKKILKQ